MAGGSGAVDKRRWGAVLPPQTYQPQQQEQDQEQMQDDSGQGHRMMHASGQLPRQEHYAGGYQAAMGRQGATATEQQYPYASRPQPGRRRRSHGADWDMDSSIGSDGNTDQLAPSSSSAHGYASSDAPLLNGRRHQQHHQQDQHPPPLQQQQHEHINALDNGAAYSARRTSETAFGDTVRDTGYGYGTQAITSNSSHFQSQSQSQSHSMPMRRDWSNTSSNKSSDRVVNDRTPPPSHPPTPPASSNQLPVSYSMSSTTTGLPPAAAAAALANNTSYRNPAAPYYPARDDHQQAQMADRAGDGSLRRPSASGVHGSTSFMTPKRGMSAIDDPSSALPVRMMSMKGQEDQAHHPSATFPAAGPAGAGAAAAVKKTTFVSMLRSYGTPHQLLFLTTVLLQAVASMVLILIIWLKIRSGTPPALNEGSMEQEGQVKRRSITVYLAIFAFGAVFEIITALDGLRLNNTIQLIGVCLFSLAMVAYSALLDGQIKNAIMPDPAVDFDARWPDNLYSSVKPFVLAMPILQGACSLLLMYFTWLLFKDFGWEVLHLIGADRKLKKMYTHYQIYLAILKFDFFFFVGFSMQYVILVLSQREVEFVITIAVFPITVVMLVLAVIAVRREIRWLMWLILVSEACGLGYFCFKLFRLFQASQGYLYVYTRKTLAVFSALAIVMLLATVWTSIACYRNFGKGLKTLIPGYWGEHKNQRRQHLARKNSNAAQGVLDTQQNRMSID